MTAPHLREIGALAWQRAVIDRLLAAAPEPVPVPVLQGLARYPDRLAGCLAWLASDGLVTVTAGGACPGCREPCVHLAQVEVADLAALKGIARWTERRRVDTALKVARIAGAA